MHRWQNDDDAGDIGFDDDHQHADDDDNDSESNDSVGYDDDSYRRTQFSSWQQFSHFQSGSVLLEESKNGGCCGSVVAVQNSRWRWRWRKNNHDQSDTVSVVSPSYRVHVEQLLVSNLELDASS